MNRLRRRYGHAARRSMKNDELQAFAMLRREFGESTIPSAVAQRFERKGWVTRHAGFTGPFYGDTKVRWTEAGQKAARRALEQTQEIAIETLSDAAWHEATEPAFRNMTSSEWVQFTQRPDVEFMPPGGGHLGGVATIRLRAP